MHNLLSDDRLLQTVLLVEAADAAAGIYHLLLAGEEGMALAADINPQLLLGGAGGEGLAAHAADNALAVLGMNLFLHCCFHLYSWSTLAMIGSATRPTIRSADG